MAKTTEKVANSVEVTLFKEHGAVNQFRADDPKSALVTGGIYLNKAYIGKSTKRVRITVEELG